MTSSETTLAEELEGSKPELDTLISGVATRSAIIPALMLGLFYVLFLWEFFSRGVYALGLNATLFGILTALLVANHVSKDFSPSKSIRVWLISCIIISSSFFLYENPFIKTINIFTLPLLALFFLRSSISDRTFNRNWGRKTITSFFDFTSSLIFRFTPASAIWLVKSTFKSLSLKPRLLDSILKGLIPLAIAYLLIIPLLSSSDSLFDARITSLINYLYSLINLTPVIKFAILMLVASSIIGIICLTKVTLDLEKTKTEKPNCVAMVDPISASIMLVGILVIYFIFIGVQIERLFVTDLPVNFSETEKYVKSGFWQLFFITLFNLILSYSYYGKTGHYVRNLLGIFNLTSQIILLSAAQRLALYVTLYGLSYEKFYASYTVLFCSILLSYLIYATFNGALKDTIRVGFHLFLVMYCLVTILPVEIIIFKSNIELSKRTDSRLDLSEMRMLSIDALGEVNTAEFSSYPMWKDWSHKISRRHAAKNVYEYTLADLYLAIKDYRVIDEAPLS